MTSHPTPTQRPERQASEQHDHADAVRTLEAARDAGLKLALNEAKDAIMAGPPEKITDHIRASVRRNKEVLMRDLLFREAVDYLEGKIADRRPPPDRTSVTATHDAFAADPDALNEAWAGPDFDAFRAELRKRLVRALQELDAHHQSESLQADKADGSPDQATQQTLSEAS